MYAFILYFLHDVRNNNNNVVYRTSNIDNNYFSNTRVDISEDYLAEGVSSYCNTETRWAEVIYHERNTIILTFCA